MLPQFFDSVLSLVVKTSTDLPPDVRAAMKVAVAEEPSSTQSGQALAIIAENIDLAADCEGAICQDTGMPTFEVKTPVGANQVEMRKQIRDAVAEATRRGKLRPNSVDSITGENSGNNLGPGTPIIHFDQWERDEIEVKLILKGGGCENMNAQYSLPMELPNLGRADRTLEGVRKCILHAVWNAQGKGCAPGALGVCIGGDRTSGLRARERAVVPHARRCEHRSAARGARSVDHGRGEQARHRHDGLRRPRVADRLQDRRAEPTAGKLLRLGRLRLLGVPPPRRRRSMPRRGAIKQWLYRDPANPAIAMADQAGFQRTGREVALQAPLSEEQMRSLKVGDVVLVSGRAYTGRDAVHAYLMKHDPPVDLRGARALSLWPGRRERGRRVEGDCGRADHQHPRGAVSGGRDQALRCDARLSAKAGWARRRWPRSRRPAPCT